MQQVQELSEEVSPQAVDLATPPSVGTPEAAPPRAGRPDARSGVRPDKFQLETRLIELGAALATVQQLFRHLERDVYLFTFGRYDE